MKKYVYLLISIIIVSCSSDNSQSDNDNIDNVDSDLLSTTFNIDFNNLPNYENQAIPNYIDEDNTPNNNQITNEVATLGRVLFYDSNLSSNNTVSCASCHKQEFAFSDNLLASQGVNGLTARHSMRLVNARFGDETNFFWDERANSLEEQTTMPIRDHAEMGFSGENGAPDFNDLITKLENIDYYPELFTLAYGNSQISEAGMQNALAQFIRSIQSFDSKYDEGRAQVNNDGQPFPNFTAQENSGKNLFIQNANFNNQGVRTGGGVNCNQCHGAPEFAIAENRGNNGVLGIINNTGQDISITRSPTLRDAVNQNGASNGPFFHDGSSVTLADVLAHYNNEIINNANLDNRLRPQGNVQNLNMTQQEISDVIAFIETLSSNDAYSNQKWSDPFIN